MNLGPEKQVLCRNHFTVFKKKASILISQRMTGACPRKLSTLVFLLWGFSCTSFFIQTAVNLQTLSTHHCLVYALGEAPLHPRRPLLGSVVAQRRDQQWALRGEGQTREWGITKHSLIGDCQTLDQRLITPSITAYLAVHDLDLRRGVRPAGL